MNKVFMKMAICITLGLMIFSQTSVYAAQVQGARGANDGNKTDQNDLQKFRQNYIEYREEREKNKQSSGTTSNSGNSNKSSSSGNANQDDWITDAFYAVKKFFGENVEDPIGIVSTPLGLFKRIVQGVNRLLLVLLAAISTISLSIVGVRYLMAVNDSNQKVKAKDALHTTFRGMGFGFGAFFIWRVAMSIVEVILDNM